MAPADAAAALARGFVSDGASDGTAEPALRRCFVADPSFNSSLFVFFDALLNCMELIVNGSNKFVSNCLMLDENFVTVTEA